MSREEYIEIVKTYSDTVFRIAFNYCKNCQDAEDVLQNVFIKLLKSKKSFNNEEHIKSWLITVAINECKSMYLSKQKKKTVYLDDIKIYDKTSDFSKDTEEKIELYNAVMTLPAKYRIVIYLYYFEDYSISQISNILSIKETSIQTQLMRAREKIKKKITGGFCDG